MERAAVGEPGSTRRLDPGTIGVPEIERNVMWRSFRKAALFSAFVILFGMGLDLFFHFIGAPWASEVFVENILTGLLAGWAGFTFMEDRRHRTEERMEALAYLNHHIRNALTAIELSRYAPDDDQRLHIIEDASRRIEITIRKISEQEHVSIDYSDTVNP